MMIKIIKMIIVMMIMIIIIIMIIIMIIVVVIIIIIIIISILIIMIIIIYDDNMKNYNVTQYFEVVFANGVRDFDVSPNDVLYTAAPLLYYHRLFANMENGIRRMVIIRK